MRSVPSVAAALLVLAGESLRTAPAAASGGEMARVVRIEDANTVVVSVGGKEQTLRLLGVVVPDPKSEKKKVADFGRLATEYLKSFLGGGAWVLVELPAGVPPDGKGRRFALVYRGTDAALANEKLIEDGYGVVPKSPPFPLSARFRTKEAAARSGRRGMWGRLSGEAAEFGSGRKSQANYLDKVAITGGDTAPYGDGYDAWVIDWLSEYH